MPNPVQNQVESCSKSSWILRQIKLNSNSTTIVVFLNSVIENNESTINMRELDKQKIIEKLRQSMEVSSTLFTSGQVTVLILFPFN